MGIDRHGSRPEWQGFGSDEWIAQNYTEKEWDPKANGGRGGPIPKTALRDEAVCRRKYVENFNKIDWSSHGGREGGAVQGAEGNEPVGEPSEGQRS